MIELVFVDIKFNCGVDCFLCCGCVVVCSEWWFINVVYNLFKFW